MVVRGHLQGKVEEDRLPFKDGGNFVYGEFRASHRIWSLDSRVGEVIVTVAMVEINTP
jgi:hypothetical protein